MLGLRRTPPFSYAGTALVTGASAGLGAAYAEALAGRGMDLILVARSAEPMHELAARLTGTTGRAVTVLPCDLTDRAARAELLREIEDRGLVVDVLVNNAGFGTKGRFAEIEADRVGDEVELNVVALTELSRAYLPAMLARGHGAIVNLASLAGFQPIPTLAVYAATKVYVRHFSQALWWETRGTGVRVVSVCPGPTDTAFMANTGQPEIMDGHRRSPEQVVEATLDALDHDRPEVVDGLLNRATGLASAVAPIRLKLPLAKRYSD